MAESNAVSNKFNEAVECSICQETFKDPRALPCLHTFCLSCLNNLCKKNAASGGKISCPLCRNEYVGIRPDVLPKNFHIENFVCLHEQQLLQSSSGDVDDPSAPRCEICRRNQKKEKARSNSDAERAAMASHCCWNCDQRMCRDCARSHANAKKHHVAEIKDRNCDRHTSSPLEIFCEQCEVTCCDKCFDDRHQNHPGTDIREMARNMREKIVGYAVNVAEKQKAVDRAIASLRDVNDAFSRRCKTTKSRIAEAGQSLTANVEADVRNLIADVSTRSADAAGRISCQQKRMQSRQKHMTEFVNTCKQILKASPTEVIRQFGQVRTNWQQLLVADTFADTYVQDFSFVEHKLHSFLPRDVRNLVGEVVEVGGASRAATLRTWNEMSFALEQSDGASEMSMMECRRLVNDCRQFVDRSTDVVDYSSRRIEAINASMCSENKDLRNSLAEAEKKLERRGTACFATFIFTTVFAVFLATIFAREAFGCVERLVNLHYYEVKEAEMQIARMVTSKQSNAVLVDELAKGYWVTAVTTLGDDIYVTRQLTDELLVYDAATFRLRESVPLTALITDIVACRADQRIYVLGHDRLRLDNAALHSVHLQKLEDDVTFWSWPPDSFQALSPTIHASVNNLFQWNGKRRLENETPLTSFYDKSVRSTVSVTPESNVLVTDCGRSVIKEYTYHGKLVGAIYVPADIVHLQHSVKLDNDRYIVCHGKLLDQLHRVLLINSRGAILKVFGGKSGSGIEQLNVPVHLAVGGFVFVADYGNERVLMLSPDLIYVRQVVAGVSPARISVDAQLGRLYVVDRRFEKEGTNSVKVYSLT